MKLSLQFLLVSIIFFAAFTQCLHSQVLEQKDLAVTIYNNNLGVVKDTRTIKFTSGISQLNFTDVAQTIIPQTVTFDALDTQKSINIIQQNFQNNLADKYSLLKNYVGKQITIYTLQGQTSNTVTGILLSYQPTFIIQTIDQVGIYNFVQGVTVGNLSTGLLIKPTLVWQVQTNSNQQIITEFSVSYRARGFQWKANYIANLNSQQTNMNFTGWVTIDNNSGKRYQNALIKLIAGDVNTQSETNQSFKNYFAQDLMLDSVEPQFSSNTISDYYIYTLNRRATINENQQKQIQFIPKSINVSIRKYQVININTGGYAQQNIKATNTIQFLNSKQNGLGIPLPKGTISVNIQDRNDSTFQFIGVDDIDHTPIDQNITITTGSAFDIAANLIVNNRTTNTNGYNSQMILNITNRATKNYVFQINLNNDYGDNCLIIQNSNNIHTVWQRKTANLFVIQAIIIQNSTLTISWKEHYARR